MKIEIDNPPDGTGWMVRVGDRWEDRLGPDEALWIVVRLLLGQSVDWLRTAEQHAAYEAQFRIKSDEELTAERHKKLLEDQREADEIFPNVRVR